MTRRFGVFGLIGIREVEHRLREGGVECWDEREVVAFFDSGEEALGFASSWGRKGGGFHKRSLLAGFARVEVEDWTDVPHGPAKRR
jgi:hypothetical protein